MDADPFNTDDLVVFNEDFEMINQIRFFSFAVFSFIVLNVNFAWSQSSISNQYSVIEASSDYSEAIAKSRDEIKVLMDAGAPGVSIAVGVDGELVWAEGFGYADIENSVPVTSLTKFRVGSVSKKGKESMSDGFDAEAEDKE
mgnify:CR=1 FL=1